MGRLAAKALGGILLALFLAALACVLWVRGAIAHDALADPYTCLNAVHYDRYKAGQIDQLRLDGMVASQVRKYHLAGRQVDSGRWHFLGMAGAIGVSLGYGKQARRAMGMQVISRMRLCPQDRLVGTWAILDHQPQTSAKDNCATDNTITLRRGGGYEGLYEEGTWADRQNRLEITVSASSEASSGEEEAVSLTPPRKLNWPIVSLDERTARVDLPDSKFWLYRCGLPQG